MKLISARMLKAVLPAFSKEESRYTLQAIHVTPEYVEATDGHRAIRVTPPTAADAKNFPIVPGFTPNGFKSVHMPLEFVKRLVKAIPRNEVIPILNYAAVSTDGDAIQAATTDIDNSQVFNCKVASGQFPNVDAVLPKDAPLATVSLNATYLRELAAAAELYGDKHQPAVVKIELFGETKAVKMTTKADTGETWTAIVMPCRT